MANKRVGTHRDNAGRWRDESGHYASTPKPKLSPSGRYRYPDGTFASKETLTPSQRGAQNRRVREYRQELERERKLAARREERQRQKVSREKPSPKPSKPSRSQKIYEAGDKEAHAEETQDAAFDAIKFLHGQKGAPRSKQMKRAKQSRQRAETSLAPFLGKEITVKIPVEVYHEGMLKKRKKIVKRTFVYTQYKDFLDATTDAIRTEIEGKDVSASAIFSGDIAVVLPSGKRKRRIRNASTTGKSGKVGKKKMGSGRESVQYRATKRGDTQKGGRVRKALQPRNKRKR